MGMVISGVCDSLVVCVFVRAVIEKRLELSTPNLLYIMMVHYCLQMYLKLFVHCPLLSSPVMSTPAIFLVH